MSDIRGWIAGGSMVLSLCLIFLVWIDLSKLRRSIYLMLLFLLLFAEVSLVVPLALGSLANLFLFFWVIFHFWLMGRFDR